MSLSRWPGVLLLLWCLAPVGAAAADAGAKGEDVPAGARAYLAELRAVAEEIARSHPSSYGFSRPVGKIELGALHPVYAASPLLLEEGASVRPANAFDAPGEWVAPVLEDGVPSQTCEA